MKEELNEHQIFHINRIMSVLLNQQTPYNDFGAGELSNCGNWKDKTRKDKAQTILRSLVEIGLLTQPEKESIIQELDWTDQIDYNKVDFKCTKRK